MSGTRPEVGEFFKDAQVAQAWRQGDAIAKWSALFGGVLLDRLPTIASGRVLDLACGAGYPTIELANRLGPAVRVVGVDFSRASIDLARKEVGARRNVTFEVGDVTALSYEDRSFQAVVCNLGLHIVSDPVEALCEWRRVLYPGGELVATVPLAGTHEEFREPFEAVVAEHGLTEQVPRSGRPTVAQLAEWFTEAGLVDVRVTADWREFEFANARALIGRFPPLLMSRQRLPESARDAAWTEIVERIDAARSGGPIRTRVGIGCASGRRPAESCGGEVTSP